MAATTTWTRRDKSRAQQILRRIAKHYGGWQAIADQLGMSADSSRATVESWHRRGRVSLPYAVAVRKLGEAAGIDCSARELSPQARHLEA